MLKNLFLKIKKFDTKKYWEKRYSEGGDSGNGSYGKLAEFKAKIINRFVKENQIKTIIESNHKMDIFIHKIKMKKENDYEILPPLLNRDIKNIFLVDDVLKSGKTIIYGIKEILEYNVENLKTIILVNRNHNKFPIGVDYVGLNLSTTLKEHIQVVLEKNKEIVYLI